MNKLELIREIVDEIVRQCPSKDERRAGFVHLYGVALTATILAEKHGMDTQLCAITGMLHDIWTYKTGDPTDHAWLSSVEAERILMELGGFSHKQINQVTGSITHHSDKKQNDAGKMGELLKDADVLHHYLYNPKQKGDISNNQRLKKVLKELGLKAHS